MIVDDVLVDRVKTGPRAQADTKARSEKQVSQDLWVRSSCTVHSSVSVHGNREAQVDNRIIELIRLLLLPP